MNPKSSARQPNIILCTCDQLRAFEVGCYGNRVIRTPHMDRLAAEGTRFETAVTSFPVCMPARSSMLSGQYARRCTGGIGNASRPGGGGMPEYPVPGRPHLPDPTLPEILADLGYYNAVIGKWHIHTWPDVLGFDYYLVPRVHHCHTGQSYTENGGPEFVPPGFTVEFEAGQVGRFLQEHRHASQPFFLFYNISPPHCPYADAPERFLNMYRPDDMPIRPNVNLAQRLPDQDHWFKVYRYDYKYYDHHLPYTDTLPDGYDLRHVLAEYYGLTSWVDEALGQLLHALDASGLSEDTILVFTSDHGDYLGSHGRVQKSGLHEESIRIPLIIRWQQQPGSRGQVVREQVAGLADLAPTMLDLAGVEAPAHMHGRSLASILRGERTALDDDAAMVETDGEGIAIRTPTHLYALPAGRPGRLPGAEPYLFFDLTRDPYQLQNLAGSAEQRPIALDLDRRLRHWHETTAWLA
jgi:arylsulfatase A-like enzyme